MPRYSVALLLLLAFFTPGLPSVPSVQGQEARSSQNIQVVTTARFPPRTSAGSVYDSDTGEPLTYGQISINGTPGGVLSDSLGRFQLGAARDGRLVLLIQALGYESSSVEINVEPSRAVFLAVALRPRVIALDHEGEARACASTTVEVFVRDALTASAPAANVTLRVQGRRLADSATAAPGTDRRTLQLRVPPLAGDPGPFTVELRATGYLPWRRSNLGLSECTMERPYRFRVWMLPSEGDAGARIDELSFTSGGTTRSTVRPADHFTRG